MAIHQVAAEDQDSTAQVKIINAEHLSVGNVSVKVPWD